MMERIIIDFCFNLGFIEFFVLILFEMFVLVLL